MSDESHEGEAAGGMDRRSMLKKSAIVGGALVWTTPVVQSVSSAAFADTQGSPPPGPDPDPDPPKDCLDGGSKDRKYSFKVEVSTSGVVSAPMDIGGSKCAPSSYSSTGTPFYFPPGTSITVDGSSFTVVLPAGYTLTEADVKAGNGKGTTSTDGCFDVNLQSDTNADVNIYEFEIPKLTQDFSHINVVFSGCVPG